jgi:hypothetical protein
MLNRIVFRKADGVTTGLTSANQIIALRASDGHGANVPYTYPAVPTPGVWMPTPPAFASPITPWMGQMTPFTMRSASDRELCESKLDAAAPRFSSSLMVSTGENERPGTMLTAVFTGGG